jgi:non-canonical purine NTP pyrophosphatase, rdgB/HAM1 family
MEMVLASRNRKKIAELETLLSQHTSMRVKILSLDDIGYTGDIEENGASFEENAYIKASVPASLGYIGIADDSGLCVDALGGNPGIFSARYAGEPCDDVRNNEKILSELSGVPDNERTAKFVCAIACVFPEAMKANGKSDISVRGECAGVMLSSGRGDNGFGYDPLFFCPELDKTFAEMASDEKNKVSHRAKAIALLAAELGALSEMR